MPVNPGRLRERVELLEATTMNTPGGPITNWDSLGSLWAAVIQVGADGRAKYSMSGTTEVTHEVMLRVGPALTLGGTLFRWRGKTLQPVEPPAYADHRERFVTIACKEVVDVGGSSSS